MKLTMWLGATWMNPIVAVTDLPQPQLLAAVCKALHALLACITIELL